MAAIEIKKLKIEQIIENKIYIQPYREYFGISSIGHNCPRALWYSFRWCSKREIIAREHRLFQRGHREEPIIIADLKAVGCKVHSTQKESVTGNGHIKGHIDGIVENLPDAPKTPHLLEMKTANDKNFNKIKKEGIEKAKPEYNAQAQGYMKLLKLKRCLFVIVNKNNDERYYERINYSAKQANQLLKKAYDIISTEFPPAKIGGSEWFECKWCEHYDICHFDEPVQENCRTCHYCDIHDEGKWACSRYEYEYWLSYEDQLEGCKDWDKLRSLLK